MLDTFRHTDATSDPTTTIIHKQNNNNATTKTQPRATCVAFGGKSRYLCIGDTQGEICLWDLKKQSRVRQFKPNNNNNKGLPRSNNNNNNNNSPVLQACLDPTATYVCALSSETFTLYHLRQATFAKQWTYGSSSSSANNSSSNTKGWCQFRFSPLQPTLMALGDHAGRIQLHNGLDQEQPHLVCGGGYTHTTGATAGSSSPPAYQLLPHHSSPITGLAFSTQNSKLLANVRANGILEFVDTSTGEVIHHQQTSNAAPPASSAASASATALAFQGVSCVVGSGTGEVQVYDLRKMMQQFGKAVTTYQMPTTNNIADNAITSLEFAPISKSSNVNTNSTITHRRSSSSNLGMTMGGAAGAGPGGVGNAVSFDLESRSSMTLEPQQQHPQILPNASTLTNPEGTTTAASNYTAAAATVMRRQDFLEDRKPAAVEVAPPPAVIDAPPVSNNTTRPNPSLESTSRRDTSAGSTAPRHSDTIATTTKSDRTVIQRNRSNSTSNTTSDHPSPEATVLLKNMIIQEFKTEMMTLKEDMEGSLRNLHVDMIRQFHRQSQEMMSVMRHQQQQMDRLTQQNEFLREQNHSLLQQQGGVRQLNSSNHIHETNGGKNDYK